MGSENEMVLENAPLLPKKSIVFHENAFTGVLGIIVECNNPQSVSEINFGQPQVFSHSVSDSSQPYGLYQASLSITNSRSLLKLISIELVMPSNPIISSSVVPFSHLQSFPASGSFPMSQFFTSGGQSTGVSASASVLPMNIQDRSPLGWTGWISLQSKGLSRVFSNTTVQKHQF